MTRRKSLRPSGSGSPATHIGSGVSTTPSHLPCRARIGCRGDDSARASIMSMPIHLLTEQTIGKIAAGEVIERPASIVKELLENSLDSGADQISIGIAEGGLREIRVVDNGCGIATDDLPLAVLRHATSKLRDFEDLNRVRSEEHT